MWTGRFVLALVSAPAAAALSFFFLWLISIVLFADRAASPPLVSPGVLRSIVQAWPLIATAFVLAFASEVIIGLPLLLLFQWKGWLSIPAFLMGGCVAAVAVHLALRGIELPAGPVAVALLFLPACLGALVFGYVGGWLR